MHWWYYGGYLCCDCVWYFVMQCMEEASVDGALIVQPINHKFDHSYVTRCEEHHLIYLWFHFFVQYCIMLFEVVINRSMSVFISTGYIQCCLKMCHDKCLIYLHVLLVLVSCYYKLLAFDPCIVSLNWHARHSSLITTAKHDLWSYIL